MAKARKPNAEELRYWDHVRDLGCIICGARWPHIHHALTGAGGRKDHMKVLPLCHYHHQGEQGIHTLSRRVWEDMFGTEHELMDKVNKVLEMP